MAEIVSKDWVPARFWKDGIDPWAVMAPFVLEFPIIVGHVVCLRIELSYDKVNTLRSSYDVKTAVFRWIELEKDRQVTIGLGSEDSSVLGNRVLSSEMDSKLGILVSRSINPLWTSSV